MQTARMKISKSQLVRGSIASRVSVAGVVGRVRCMAACKASVSSRDLLIVGPGVLGSYLGKLWKDKYPDACVVGQTNSTDSHERCAKSGTSASYNKQ